MGSRERKRAERQKRKRRTAERPEATGSSSSSEPGRSEIPEVTVPAAENGEPPLTRSELKDAEARAALEPLEEGERPPVVTAAAVISAALVILSALGYALWDTLRDDARPPFGGVAVFVVLFGAMAWGLWRVRYWAVMGFQTVLVFVLVATSLGLIQATTLLQAVGDLVLIGIAGGLFYLMIRAMARIQMPERAPRD